jgi:hypothetical protein
MALMLYGIYRDELRRATKTSAYFSASGEIQTEHLPTTVQKGVNLLRYLNAGERFIHHGMARPQVADVRWVPCHHSMARPQIADVRWVPCHHRLARSQVADVRWIPCHHGMARPQVADVRWLP